MNLWNNWPQYEKLLLGALLLIVLFVIPGTVWMFTKNKKLLFASVLSILIAGIIVTATLVVSRQFFDVSITEVYKIVPFITIFVITLGLGTLVGFYMQNRKHKNFNMLELSKEVRNDYIKLSLSLLLLLLALSILAPYLILPLLFALGDSLITLWLSYLLIHKLVN